VKKIILSLVAIGVLAGAAAAGPPEKKTVFSLNAGIAYDTTDDEMIVATLDARVGFRLGSHFQLSPEVTYAPHPQASILSPGLILNYISGHVFIGGGVLAQFHGSYDSFWAVKFNVGYARGHLLATAYFSAELYTDEYTGLFGSHRVGLTAGYRF